MAEVGLKAESRSGTGKSVTRKLRAQGKVPAVVYGRGSEPFSVVVDARALKQSLSTDAGSNVLIDLQVDGNTHLTMPRQVERHPLRGDVLHVDFLKIARDEKIGVDVPIHIEGDSPGVKEGGQLEHHTWQLHLECLPTSVPERINVDISNLAIGDVIHVSDIQVPDGVTVLTTADDIVVTCVTPQEQQVEAQLDTPATAAEGDAASSEGSSEGDNA